MALSDGALRIATGDAEVAIPGRHRTDEIGVLTRAFHEMTVRLKHNQDELEEKRIEIEDANHRLVAQNQELQRVNEVFEQLSITDDLTKLYNHRFFQEHLPREMKRAERTGEPLSLILIDIDDFKRLNDRHGHSVGDAVLRRVADVMSAEVREMDLLARYGGEEFALLASQTTLEGAAALAEKLRVAVSEARFRLLALDGPAEIRVTVSAGVTTYRGDEKAFFNEADRALYRAKDAGKDCIVVSEEEPVVAPQRAVNPASLARRREHEHPLAVFPFREDEGPADHDVEDPVFRGGARAEIDPRAPDEAGSRGARDALGLLVQCLGDAPGARCEEDRRARVPGLELLLGLLDLLLRFHDSFTAPRNVPGGALDGDPGFRQGRNGVSAAVDPAQTRFDGDHGFLRLAQVRAQALDLDLELGGPVDARPRVDLGHLFGVDRLARQGGVRSPIEQSAAAEDQACHETGSDPGERTVGSPARSADFLRHGQSDSSALRPGRAPVLRIDHPPTRLKLPNPRCSPTRRRERAVAAGAARRWNAAARRRRIPACGSRTSGP